VPIEHIEVAKDGLSAELTLGSLVKDRVYIFNLKGVKSATGEGLANAIGAYTLNEAPAVTK
jgi:hypothetical protein